MNAAQTGSDPLLPSNTRRRRPHAYHVSIGAARHHIAYADIRPPFSMRRSSASTSPREPLAPSDVRRRLLDAVFENPRRHAHLEPCWPPCPSVTSTLLADWPNNGVNVHTRAAWLAACYGRLMG